MLLYDELPMFFPFYNKIEKQNRFRENVKKHCDYKLISPANALLPFQIKTPPGTLRPIRFGIHDLSGQEQIDLTLNIDLLTAIAVEEGTYIFYKGEVLQFNERDELNLPKGGYYAVLTFEDESKYFSEVFYIPENNFKAGQNSEFVKIELSNSCDLYPIMYAGGFKQVAYLDTFVHASDPEIEEDGERDGDDQLIPTFQKMIVRYRFSVVVPDFVKIALVSMQMHSNILLTTERGAREGSIERVSTTSTIDADGSFSTVDILLEQLVMVKQACCDDMVVVNANPWI